MSAPFHGSYMRKSSFCRPFCQQQQLQPQPYSKQKPATNTNARQNNTTANTGPQRNRTSFDLEGPPMVMQPGAGLVHLTVSLQQLYNSLIRDSITAQADLKILRDNRVLCNMLRSEQKYIVSDNYFSTVQTEVKAYMRKIVVKWMYEVCQEEGAEPETFVVALSYFDRFLCVEAVHKNQLQVLAATCLFLASKVKQTQPIFARKLAGYVDDRSVTVELLMSWELLILGRLKWDLSSVTVYDFLDHFLFGLNLPTVLSHEIKQRVQVLIPAIVQDFTLAVCRPSVLAGSCLCVAVQQLLNSRDFLPTLLCSLQTLSGLDAATVKLHVDMIDQFWHVLDVENKNEASYARASLSPSSDPKQQTRVQYNSGLQQHNAVAFET